MFSIEEALVSWLPGELGVPCYGQVPEERPAEFCTVERTGGGSEVGIDRPEVAVQLWAGSKARAMTLGLNARDSLRYRAVEIPGVRGCSVNAGPYSFPDPDSRTPRYQLFCAFTTV